MDLGIGKIEKSEFYIDTAFRRGRAAVAQKRVGKGDGRIHQIKRKELLRLSIIKDSLGDDMKRILNRMPMHANLDDFYKELFKCFVDLDEYKQALGGIKWVLGRITSIHKNLSRNIAREKTEKGVISIRNVFLARCSSFMKQVVKNLTEIEKARKQIRKMPNIKSSMITAAIAGFPNVGKSTLLGKITGSKPEINSYAFTTKGLMIGYIKSKEKIQVIDTPGTLNRFDKMNNIEKMAHLTMKKLASKIVYIFDLTEPYPIEEQIKLYENIKKLHAKVIVYFSKSDILDKEQINKFSIKGTSDPEEIKKFLS